MHELSIVLSIIHIAEKELAKNNASSIEEIEMDIGVLSSIEMNAFDFAWQQAVKETVLENAVKKINRIKGKAQCLNCSTQFEIQNLYDDCHNCGNHQIQILAGKELQVKSLIVSN